MINSQVMSTLLPPVIFMAVCLWKTMLRVRTTSSGGSVSAQSNDSCTSLDHLQSSGRSYPDPDRPQAGPAPTPQASTSSAALSSNSALKYAAVLKSRRLSAWLAVRAQKCRVCLTFLKRFCNRGKRLSWPHSVISGTLPARYSVLHSAGFITLEADTLVARLGKLVVTAGHGLSHRRLHSC